MQWHVTGGVVLRIFWLNAVCLHAFDFTTVFQHGGQVAIL